MRDLDVTVLSAAARLTRILGIAALRVCVMVSLVCDLGFTDISLDLELTKKSVNDYLKVKLAHAGDDGLTRLFIGIALEGRILFGELCKRDSHLLLACLGLGLDSDPDNGIGELHGLKDYRMPWRRRACRR